MNAISQSDFLLALGWAVLNSLWQMAILWVLFQLITGINKKLSPARKANIATSFLFAGFVWFCFSLFSFVAGIDGTNPAAYGSVINYTGNAQMNSWLSASLPLASFAYLLLLIFPVANFFRNYRYVQSIRRYGLSRADVKARLFVQQMAPRMGIRKNVYLWISEMVTSPVTIGYIRPVILLPLAAVNHLTTEQMEAVLLHELSHIRRYDYFLNLVIKFIQSVLYFNPFVKAFIKSIEREREKSCDEMVIQFQYEPLGYASALLQLEKANHLPKLLTVAAAGRKNDLLHRVEWIMGIRKKNQFSFSRVAGVLAAVCCFIAFNALMIVGSRTNSVCRVASASPTAAPLYYLSENGTALSRQETGNETNRNSIYNYPVHQQSDVSSTPTTKQEHEQPDIMGAPVPPAPKPATLPSNSNSYSFASLVSNVIPMLEAQKEAQINIALEASKKVIADGQWKEMEKNIADAMNSMEKDRLKKAYDEAMSKLDLTKVNENLHVAYDLIDWQNVNVQLNNALAEIKIDSVEKVYNIAIDNLANLQNEMQKNKLSGIPDSDVTLKTVAEKKKEAVEVVNRLNTLRTKKIIRL